MKKPPVQKVLTCKDLAAMWHTTPARVRTLMAENQVRSITGYPAAEAMALKAAGRIRTRRLILDKTARDRIAHAYATGRSITELAAEYGCGASAMRTVLVDAGVTLRKNRMAIPEAISNGLVEGYRSGKTIGELARKADIGYRVVQRHLVLMGVTLREGARPTG